MTTRTIFPQARLEVLNAMMTDPTPGTFGCIGATSGNITTANLARPAADGACEDPDEIILKARDEVIAVRRARLLAKTAAIAHHRR